MSQGRDRRSAVVHGGLALGTIMLVVIAATLTVAAAAAEAATTEFSSSFEAGDRPLDWTNTAETDAQGNKKMSGVTGSSRSGIPGNISDKIKAVTASAENPPNEAKENAFDGSVNTKWLVFANTGWLQAELSEPVAVVDYAVTSANDAPGRDPKDWRLQGSQDGQSWTTLDTQTGQDFGNRFQTREYRFANTTAYSFYRLDITANHGDGLIQLAELQLSNGDTTPAPPSDMKADVSSGPVNGPNMLPNAGFTGMKALQYSGEHTADGHGYAYDKVYDVDVAVTKDTELSYEIFPELTNQDLAYPSTYAAVDLAFSDGTYLSDLHAVDQHGAELSPQGQGASKTLYADQWNHQLSRIGDVAAGKTIKRILIGYDNPSGPALFNGWVDDIAIAGHPSRATRSHPSDWAITTRGTNSSGSFSRGNNFPATAVPHGFNFWTPETDAGSKSWLYEYQRANNADNLPTLQAFGLSHEPSPWMGDRQTFQVMPSTASGTPDADRAARALPFRHDNEVARPYYYGVTFENGLKGEIAPTDHAALLRFSFPGDDASLIFDNVDDQSDVTIDQQAGTIGGWTDTNSGAGATRMFIYATFDKPMTASGMLADGNRPGTGYARFDTSKGRVITMRVATSLISLAQAKHNLALEVGQSDTFDTIKARAQRAWDEKLGVVEVQGATDDQRTTLYSSLYRLNLYPNSAFENTGTNAHPIFQHAVQSTAGDPPPSTPTQTGAPVKPGKVYVNNGFWDTYRTAWPAYSLLYPKDAGEMVDGFVQQYRDGGWVARWSSPGYANLMTGTSSDVAFADAYVKGVKGFDATDAYDAALRNATVAPPGSNPFDTDVGRKGLIQSVFLGYTPNEVPEGLSWGLEGYINDYGIGNMAAALADRARSASARQRYREESTYFLSRAQGYVRLFDKRVGFFQGKSASGQWTTPPDQFDPRVWRQGGDYTETDGWNFAFHAPQDGRGLADLYGGRSQLAAKLDQFFATPETAKFPGTYGGTIHEMLEARDVRLGQWGASNQISHHIPYMYDFTGQPSKGQAIIREALRRLFVGSEIGQGYPGDEDNGEMSAWYVFSALGLYPLQVGSPNYAIGSPLFTRAVIHRQGGGDIVVNAPQNSAGNVCVRSLRVNGRDWNKTYVSQDDLARGARLDFGMGPQPSSWGTAANAAPPSLTTGADAPFPLTDAANPADGDPSAGGGTDASGLFDDTSKTQVTLTGTGRWAQFDLDRPRHVTFYTLTSGHDDGADPSGWVVKGSDDGHHWRVLDVRSGERFQWRSQTRPFALRHTGDFTRYRIEFTHPGAGRTTLSEIEFLSDRPIPPSPLAATATGGVGRAGDTVPVHVTITNSGTTPASGQLTLTVPSGWTQPVAAAFGPVAPGESETVDVGVSVPAGTAADSYMVRATARAAQGTARATTTIQVIGDTIEFTPGTDAEKPWLVDPDGSQLDGAIHDGNGRFADNGAHFTYRFDIPAGVTGGKLTLEIGNEYLVSVSSDDQTYREVLRETNEEHDLNNLDPPHELDLNTLLGGSRTLYVRIGDSFPQDGWGGWLGHLKLELTRT
jgi:predicted alpha-1,2-mannosidase